MRKVIRDPIHGYIELNEVAIEIIDTVEMQRLRMIRQLGFSYLVYPGANHTRFEHSRGTYHLMNVLLDKLGVAKEEEKELIVASLIHDVGHGPYSHVTEPLIKKFSGRSHEDIEDILWGKGNKHKGEEREKKRTNGETPSIAPVLERHRLDRRKIMEYIKVKKKRKREGGKAQRQRDLSKNP
jgi:HD superfamily phosphohydrolase